MEGLYLRIEDTDQTRYVSGAEPYHRSVEWLNIPLMRVQERRGCRTYRQSERKTSTESMQTPWSNGKAYYAFDTAEALNEKTNESSKDIHL